MLRALVFDFDGLVVDTETPLVEAYGDVYRKHGVAFDRAEFERQIGHASFAFDPWRAFGPGADREALEQERRAINLARTEQQPVLPGIRALIEAASGEGLRLGIASNSSHGWVEGHLRRLGLHGFFSAFGCKGDTPAPKPEPDIYRLVVNALGCRAVESVALEDSAAGVKAALRAGLWVVAIPNATTADHDHDGAHWTVASAAEVSLPALRTRFGG